MPDSARLFAASEHSGPYARLFPIGEVLKPSPRRLKIAVSTKSATGVEAHPEVASAVEKTAKLCSDLGHTVIPAEHPIDGEHFLDSFLSLWRRSPGRAAGLRLPPLNLVRMA